MRRMITTALSVSAAVTAAALWWRRHPSACPYGQRFWVQAPHPFITHARLRETLDPQPGERLLEVGPGTGYYALEVAQWLAPAGTLAIFDLQQEMLDHTLNEAGRRGLENLEPTRGDAQALPYDDDSFDGAYICCALGEIPDPGRALAELARVTRHGGRVIVGELFGDPHMVTSGALAKLAPRAGLRIERRIGPWVGSFTRLLHA